MLLPLSLLLYFILSLVATYAYEKWAIKFAWVDTPNHRSSHQKITPRGAGVVFTLVWAIFLLFSAVSHELKFLLLPGFLLNAAIGFLDDKQALSAKRKLMFQLLASLYFATLLIVHWHLSWAGILFPIMLLWVTGSLNLFNFMDGLDGLAATHALLFLVPSSFLLLLIPEFSALTLPILSLCVGIAAFLCFNFPPARIFMGDVGSCALGFLIGCIAMIFLAFDWHYFIASVLFLGVFLCDTSITLVRRYLAGERVFDAHKKHAYQRLHQTGASHRQVLKVNAAMQTFFSVLGLWVARESTLITDVVGITVMLVIFAKFYLYVERQKPMFS